jgi:hypothetical protein
MGYNELKIKQMVEQDIIDDYCTEAFIEKEFAKIVNEKEGWKSQYIPMLLGRVYSELVKEEIWNILKQFKNPKIDFKTLNALLIQKVKKIKHEIFS